MNGQLISFPVLSHEVIKVLFMFFLMNIKRQANLFKPDALFMLTA